MLLPVPGRHRLPPKTNKKISDVNTKSWSGFTIVETLFVLAIAGLILLLVFEAIPAVERSSRNNQRQQDVSAIFQAVSHYELDNGGVFPPTCGITPPLCNATNQALQYTNLTYYDDTQAGNVEVINQTLPVTNKPAMSSSDPNATSEVYVYNYEKCNTDGSGSAVTTGAGYYDVVALYALETGGSNNAITAICQQL
jgi:type II secretory pathway pseudopilin PulG